MLVSENCRVDQAGIAVPSYCRWSSSVFLTWSGAYLVTWASKIQVLKDKTIFKDSKYNLLYPQTYGISSLKQ